jgi:hypothetical protein
VTSPFGFPPCAIGTTIVCHRLSKTESTATASPFLMSDCRTFVQWNSAALFAMEKFAYVFILIFQGSKNGVLCVLEYNAVLNVDVRLVNCKTRRRWLGKSAASSFTGLFFGVSFDLSPFLLLALEIRFLLKSFCKIFSPIVC